MCNPHDQAESRAKARVADAKARVADAKARVADAKTRLADVSALDALAQKDKI